MTEERPRAFDRPLAASALLGDCAPQVKRGDSSARSKAQGRRSNPAPARVTSTRR